jgi:hypothetical protein
MTTYILWCFSYAQEKIARKKKAIKTKAQEKENWI